MTMGHGNQVSSLKRLSNISCRVKRRGRHLKVVRARNDDKRDGRERGVLVPLSDEGPSIHDRHCEVEEYEARRRYGVVKLRQCVTTVGSRDHAKPFPLKSVRCPNVRFAH